MAKHTLFARPSLLRKKARTRLHEENGNGENSGRQQPQSDGSEEFFEEFTPENRKQKDQHKRDILVGLGVTVGVLIGVGATIWLRKNKASRRKRRRWFS
jgi:hypothetical protein